jgi:hypothetical protein
MYIIMNVKTKTSKILMAIFHDTVIHVHVLKDIHECNEYIKFSLHSYKPNSYMDIIFKLDNAPVYVNYLYRFIERNNRISLSDEKLSYIIQGPCLESKKIFKISNIFVTDFNRMLSKTHELVYDYDTALILSENILKPIYEMIGGI